MLFRPLKSFFVLFLLLTQPISRHVAITTNIMKKKAKTNNKDWTWNLQMIVS